MRDIGGWDIRVDLDGLIAGGFAGGGVVDGPDDPVKRAREAQWMSNRPFSTDRPLDINEHNRVKKATATAKRIQDEKQAKFDATHGRGISSVPVEGGLEDVSYLMMLPFLAANAPIVETAKSVGPVAKQALDFTMKPFSMAANAQGLGTIGTGLQQTAPLWANLADDALMGAYTYGAGKDMENTVDESGGIMEAIKQHPVRMGLDAMMMMPYAGSFMKSVNDIKEIKTLRNNRIKQKKGKNDYDVIEQFIPGQSDIGREIKDWEPDIIKFVEEDVDPRVRNMYLDDLRLYEPSIHKEDYPIAKIIRTKEDIDVGGWANRREPDIKIVENNLDKFNGGIDEIYIHEMAHKGQYKRGKLSDNNGQLNPYDENIRDLFNGHGYTDRAVRFLERAYQFTDDYLKNSTNKSFGINPILEKGASNREMRYYISKQNNLATGKELDEIIDNISDEELMLILNGTNGYTRNFAEKILENVKNGESLSANMQRIRSALKYVPSIAIPLLANYKNK